MARDHGESGEPEYRVERAPRLLRAEAGADATVDRVHRHGPAAAQYLTVAADDLEVVEDGVASRWKRSTRRRSRCRSCSRSTPAAACATERRRSLPAPARSSPPCVRRTSWRHAVRGRVDMAHDLSTNRDAAQAAIDRYKTAGGTALYDAVSDSLARLQRAEGRRVVVVMTDGRDENNPGTGPGSTRSFSEVLEREGERRHGVLDRAGHQSRPPRCRSWPICRVAGRSCPRTCRS